MSSMSRKHYNEAAEILNDFARNAIIPTTQFEQEHFDNLVQHFANMFAKDNPNFDRRRFLAAVERFGQ